MPADAPSTPKAQPVVRYVLIGILAVGLIGLAFDLVARRKAQAAFDQLDSRDLEKVVTTSDEVHRMLNRDPDSPGTEELGELREQFSWTGVRTYTVYVRYSSSVGAVNKRTWIMDSVALNQAP